MLRPQVLRMFSRPILLLLATAPLLLGGCLTSSAPPEGAATQKENTPVEPAKGDGASSEAANSPGASSNPSGEARASAGERPAFPDVPLMTEVDGIAIPRLPASSDNSITLGQAIPADVDNEHAKKNQKPVADGDWVTIRFNSEPARLNPLTEPSAVTSYIQQYILEPLAWQNPETYAFEPHIAKHWIVEDSITLSPDYPGMVRRLKPSEGNAASELSFVATKPEKDKPVTYIVRTVDGDGKAVGKTWVGVFAAKPINGVPRGGLHYWSNEQGLLELTNLLPGEYILKTGAQIYGISQADGETLKVTAGTAENPLKKLLEEKQQESLTLKAGEFIDVQKQVYTTYYLRDDVKWSNGDPYTTRDLLFGYALLNNPTVDCEQTRVYYNDLVECDALSPTVLRTRYRQQYFKSFEFSASLGQYSPSFAGFEKRLQAKDIDEKIRGFGLTFEHLDQEQENARKKLSVHGERFGKFFNVDSWFNLSPLGTGPYMFESWQAKESVTLARNPNYWNKQRAGHLNKLVFRFITDNVTALQALRAGEIDFLYRADAEQYHRDLGDQQEWFKGKFVKAAWYTPNYGYIGWNLRRPFFEDRRVRIALALAFDKEEFLDKKMHRLGKSVSGSQYYFGPAYDHGVQSIAYDADVARALLDEAGWIDTNNNGIRDKNGKEFRVSIQVPPGNPVTDDRINVMKARYEEIGVSLDIIRAEWASFVDKLKSKDFDLVTLSWAMDLESDPWQLWHSSGAAPDNRGSNSVSFANATADELMEQIRVTLDPKLRQQMQFSFHRLLDSEQPYTFLYCAKDLGAYHQRFRNVKWYRLRPGFDLSEWYVPKDEQLHP